MKIIKEELDKETNEWVMDIELTDEENKALSERCSVFGLTPEEYFQRCFKWLAENPEEFKKMVKEEGL